MNKELIEEEYISKEQKLKDWLDHYDISWKANKNDIKFPHRLYDRFILEEDGYLVLKKVFLIAGFSNLIWTYNNDGIIKIKMKRAVEALPEQEEFYTPEVDFYGYNVKNSTTKEYLDFVVKVPFFVEKPEISVSVSNGVVTVNARIVEYPVMERN